MPDREDAMTYYLTLDNPYVPSPASESRLATLAHRAGVEVPHLVVALATLVAGIATLIAL
jgi:hypothetical protein